MKAMIIGATGATGKELVNVLLNDSDYTEVVTFVRRSSGLVHRKLAEVVTDFDNLEAVSAFITGDVLFSCLGTTRKAAGSQAQQQHIDYDIPLKFASIARAKGVGSVVLLSAYGASPLSKVFYSWLKGKLEVDIDALSFGQYIIFRPGLLLRKGSDRAGERIMGGLLKFLNSLGLLRKFRPMPTPTLAAKLAKAPKALGGGKHVVSLEEIFGF